MIKRVIAVLALVSVLLMGATVIVINAVYDQPEIAAPANPASGFDRVYMDSTTHQLTCLNSSGGNCLSTVATSIPFSGVTTASNTTATMTVGTGGTITFSGTGVNNANQLNGTAFAGTSGHLVSFGAANIPADSSIVATSVPIIVAKGTLTLATGAISSGTCTAAQTATATGACAGAAGAPCNGGYDNVMVDFQADPTGTTGWAPSANGGLFLYKYVTADTVNVKVCNNTSASVTPGAALTLQWRVIR